MDSLLSMSPVKCLKSILFICFCVYVPRLNSLPEDRHFVSIHASLTAVLKPLNGEVRKTSSRFCSPEKGGGEGEVPHYVVPRNSNQLSRFWREANVSETNNSFIQQIFLYSAPNICQMLLYQAQC